MRLRVFAPLLLVISVAALVAGCNSKSSSGTTDVTSPTSSAAGTPVRQPLGASSVGGVKPAPAPSR